LKFDLVVAIFPNLVTNDYKSHVVVNGLVTFWLIFISVSLNGEKTMFKTYTTTLKLPKIDNVSINVIVVITTRKQ